MLENSETEAERLKTSILRKMTPEQKWREAMSLRNAAWQLKSARIRSLHPEFSEERVYEEVKKIFLYAVT